MQEILEYKGFFTKIKYSKEDEIYHGKIEDIRDLVTFQSDARENIEKEFHDAVDDYLKFKEEVNNLIPIGTVCYRSGNAMESTKECIVTEDNQEEISLLWNKYYFKDKEKADSVTDSVSGYHYSLVTNVLK